MSSRPGGGGRPLRIGLVCPYALDRHGGVQNQVLGLARYLRSVGHEASVLAPGQPFPDAGLDHRWFTSTGASVPVPYNGSVARVSFGPLVARRVAGWLRAGDFDLVHVHEPITPSISLLATAAAEVPLVATFHTATPRSRTMLLAGRVLTPLVDKLGARIAVSEAARSVVRRHLGRDTVVLPNGFDHGRFRDRPITRGPRPRVTFLGRLDEPRKGLPVLLAALPAVRAAVPAVEVVVAGEGSRRLPPGVRALGPVTEVAKVDLLASTDVFVAPQQARESFGIVLLEALASRAAVVASDLPPFVDLLAGPPPLGRLVPTGDPAALAAAIVAALGEVGPPPHGPAATARYDWATVGRETVAIYDEVLGRQASGAGSTAELVPARVGLAYPSPH